MLLPKHRGDLVQTAVAVERMRSGAIEALHVPDQPPRRARPAGGGGHRRRRVGRRRPVHAGPPLRAVRDAAPLGVRRDAGPAQRPLPVRRVPRAAAARRVGPGRRHAHRPAGRAAAGRHQRRHDPRPRPVRGVPGRREGRRRVGELDEEMVYESRVGDVFALGATSWRIEDITHDRVLVSPAPGQPGRLPFWKGDQLGRPAELGAAIGAFTRELSALSTVDGQAALHRRRPGRLGRGQPGGLPRRAARGDQHHADRPDACWSSGSATSSATGGS